jgi:hypothetical protein
VGRIDGRSSGKKAFQHEALFISMRRAVWEKFGEDSDSLLDFGEVENLQQVSDIAHILLAFLEI